MEDRITIRRLRFRTVVKLVAIGNLCSLVPFSLVTGILSLLGAGTVQWNDQPITGFAGLIASPFVGLFLAGIWTILCAIPVSLGLWAFSKFRPITVSYEALPVIHP